MKRKIGVGTVFLLCGLQACSPSSGTSTDSTGAETVGTTEGSSVGEESSDASGSEAGSELETESTETGGCDASIDCGPDQVCAGANECEPAWGREYDLVVDELSYEGCVWSPDDCEAEAYLRVYVGDSLIEETQTYSEGPSHSWLTEPVRVEIGQSTELRIEFWDYDVFESLPGFRVTEFCWPTAGPTPGCGPVPIEALRDGVDESWIEDDVAYRVRLRFEPVW